MTSISRNGWHVASSVGAAVLLAIMTGCAQAQASRDCTASEQQYVSVSLQVASEVCGLNVDQYDPLSCGEIIFATEAAFDASGSSMTFAEYVDQQIAELQEALDTRSCPSDGTQPDPM